MSEPVKIFGLDDYQHYFTSVSLPSEADTETSLEESISSDETMEIVEQETVVLQQISTDLTTVTNLSIGLIVAMGLLIGIQLGKIFLDKIWR